ncbi:SDR family NAD(P)-dependent oxidoreductase [Deinococcus altitudinis]|uniref:SDR family NAD(P)-dependent oxidoreductase n=1 Tax=Deinococcus altitudinis TaxID=468914 RepID=UPI003891784D
MELNGAVVLVTGASGGIGLAAARLMAAKGAKVALAARSAEALEQLSAELPGSLAVPTDMTDEAAVRSMVRAVQDHYGRLDVLVNNAGRGMHVPFEQIDLAGYRSLLELNVVSVVGAMQAAIPGMRAQGGGMVVNVSSGTTKMILPGVATYSSSKHALNNLSHVAHAELAKDNIRVSVVYPFITETNFAAAASAGNPQPQSGRPSMPGDTAEYAGGLIVEAIETEQAEVYAEAVKRMGQPRT